MKKGKFITVYGINGIGKTTQVNLLVEYLRSKGIKASRLKYPVYDLKPEGPLIYQYLRDPKFRKKNKMTTDQLQEKYAQNRKRYESLLKKRLQSGEWIVAEDYIGTGLAWGMTWGGDLEYLEKINKKLYQPDISILMHGDRFDTAVEKNHRNEMESERIKISKNFHLLLANRCNWKIINAHRNINLVKRDIIKQINILFK